MDDRRNRWYYPNMTQPAAIPAFGLYGEGQSLPDVLHCERIRERARLHDWQIAPHSHPNLHQTVLIRRGDARITVDGRTRELALPVLLNIPPWVVHGFRFAARTEGYVLTLPADAFPELLGEHALLAQALSTWGAVAADADLDPLFEALLDEQARDDPARAPMLRALATQVLCRAARSLFATAPGAVPARYAGYMQAFDALVQRHLGENRRVSDHAAELGLTATHLNRICRALAGMSAGRYIEARRLHEAQRLLAYTRQPVAEVGYALGYDDPAYFSRVFRRQMGETPSACRLRLAGSDLPPLTPR
ncbi:helix-turn-helix domain-containing protein [Pararhodobacter sp. SW119]|uniref:helix-turn-helix domain-containing protein n=1 Tax=Pararhodobacter sp. SW119 TaxID=2780075 RepID=UPI001ADF6702|nr:helix-turn-helix domain-containing protein [Pararhodobacter sp. SW119]